MAHNGEDKQMNYKEAKKIIQSIDDRWKGDKDLLIYDVAFMLSVLAVKLETWAPERYKDFQDQMKQHLKIEV